MYNLSLLVLAHTPKRDLTKPLTRNYLQGSKVLMNFCDSSFAIGESSSDSSFRYIKMIKVRSTEHIYDSYNIIVCQITKPDNFLHFNFLHFDSEYKHLMAVTERDREILEEEVRKCMEEQPAISAYAIAKRLCPEEKKFTSFKIKILRIYKKIIKDIRPDEEKSDEEKPDEHRPFNERPENDKPDDDRLTNDNRDNDRSGYDRPDKDKPVDVDAGELHLSNSKDKNRLNGYQQFRICINPDKFPPT